MKRLYQCRYPDKTRQNFISGNRDRVITTLVNIVEDTGLIFGNIKKEAEF